ncbi:MAG: aminotransferase class V-fold PLP-dependent enzyme, partial [Myxococcales bacterium]|nr:aminotransferase class V-fold PLP-dependent enzyme [Myxococcales bacterium]
AALCRERGVLFHSDAAQALGKIPLSASELGVDLLSFSGHKVYGPKGIGALYVRSGRPRIRLEPLLYGGGHERGLRAGTLPTHLIVGFARAVELCVEEREAEALRLAALRDDLLRTLREHLGGVSLNGHPTRRLPGNLHVSFDGIDADQLIADVPEVAISTGSACTSKEPRPSHVLAALGHSEERVRSGIRIGLGRGTDAEQIARAAAAIVRGVKAQRVSSGTDVYGSLRSPASSS